MLYTVSYSLVACLQGYLHRCDELKSLIQRLVLLGVAGDSEGTCDKIVVEMGSLRSVLQKSLDSAKRGFEGADDITRKCAKVGTYACMQWSQPPSVPPLNFT